MARSRSRTFRNSGVFFASITVIPAFAFGVYELWSRVNGPLSAIGAFFATITFVPAFVFGIYKLVQRASSDTSRLRSSSNDSPPESKKQPVESHRPSIQSPPRSHSYTRSPGALRIFIKNTCDESSTSIEAQKEDTIATIRQRYQDQTGILPSGRLISSVGKQLEDDYTLENYSIQEGSTLHLVSRARN